MQDDKQYALLAGYCRSFNNDIKYEYVRELIKEGAIDYQIPKKSHFRYRSNEVLFGYTALHITAADKDYKNFKSLIDNNADYTIKNGDNETALHLVVKELYTNEKSSVELRKFLDSILSAHVKSQNCSNPTNKRGLSHFHAACIRSQTKLVKLFLKNEVSANEAIGMKSKVFPGYTPMHFAAHFGCLSTAKVLLNRGAHVNCKDAEGFTPLDLLIKRNMEIADWVNMGKSSCYDRLKREYEKNEKIVVMIMEKMQLQDSSMQLSNLHVACTLQNTSKLELQLQNEDINLNQSVVENSVFCPGFTALHFAAIFNKKSVQLLLNKGADFSIKNTEGLTPFDLCLQRYEVDDLCAFVKSVPTWKGIKFFNSKISLLSALSAMKSEKTFGKFLKNLKDIHMHIPWKSPIFPGYTLLHIAVALPDRRQDIKSIIKPGFYDTANENVKVHFNCSKEEEDIYLRRIKMCLDSGADLTDAHNGPNSLHLAFELQKESAVDFLLKSGVGKTDYSNKSNVRHLHVACAAGNKTIVEELISASPDSLNQAVTTAYKYRNFDISSGSTPLHIAVLNQNTEIVKLLVLSGADIYAQDSKGLTPIHQIFVQGSKEKTVDPKLNDIATYLFAADNLREIKTSFGLSHLHVASYTNKATAIEKLVTNGANIEATIENSKLHRHLKTFKGLTPLHLALKLDCADVVVTLLQRGANIVDMPYEIIKKFYAVKYYFYRAPSFINELASREKNFGLTKLHVACAKLDVQRVRELLDEGADPNAQMNKDSPIWPGDTPLHFVLLRRQNNPMNDIREIIDLLLASGADVTLAGLRDNTAIHRAAYNDYDPNGTFEFPQQLLLAHTDFSVNPTNDEGLSHFHIACRRNAIGMVEAFLKRGVDDVNRKIDFAAYLDPGYTALHVAARKKFGEVVGLLLDHGADTRQRNIFYRMPIHEAAIYVRGQQDFDEEVLLRLAKNDEDIHSTTVRGMSPLEILLYSKSPTTYTFKTFLKDKNRVNLFNPIRGEGFLSTAIYFNITEEQLLQNPFFAEVLNSPEANGPDEMGRSAVHNIVSFLKGYISAPVKVYVRALLEMMRVGFDIDHQDATGQTALHRAARYQNVNGFTALLKVGADINVTDEDGKTPMFLISQWFENQYLDTKDTQRKILKAALDQIYKLQNAGIHVNGDNIIYGATLRKYWEQSFTAEKVWQAEKEKLKDENVGSTGLKLSSFLYETGAVASYPKLRASKRQRIGDFFQTNASELLQNYPHYGGLIMLQYRKAQSRVNLIKVSRKSLGLLIDYSLPDICCDCILGYLSNEHLKKLTEK